MTVGVWGDIRENLMGGYNKTLNSEDIRGKLL